MQPDKTAFTEILIGGPGTDRRRYGPGTVYGKPRLMSERDNTSCSLWRDSESDIGLMTRLTSNHFFCSDLGLREKG